MYTAAAPEDNQPTAAQAIGSSSDPDDPAGLDRDDPIRSFVSETPD
jgi:hypothetical protein